MRGLLVASVVLLMAGVSYAGDLILNANGFGQGHRGNGAFTLTQGVDAKGNPAACWSQNRDNDGWVVSFSDNGGILTATYCRNGFPQAVYRVTGTTLSGQTIGLTSRVITGPVPGSVSITP